jgi:lipoprotein-anchoring transpeptidase ErfK/SrfK
LINRRRAVNKKILLLAIAILIAFALILSLFFARKSGITVNVPKINLGSASKLVNQAREFEAKGMLLEAKSYYQKAVSDFPSAREVMDWQKKSDELNIRLIFSPAVTPGSVLYEIQPGDTLTKIAREFKTTTELIIKSNNLGEGKIFPGKKIKVYNAPFSILVYKSQNILILKSNEEIIKTYVVSTGKNNCTPVGNFKIVNKLPNPTWFKAGAVVSASSPENILGTRWMGFELAGYGIHGTTEPQFLGKQVTAGCVRMANPDVEELYTLVPVGTEVSIVE